MVPFGAGGSLDPGCARLLSKDNHTNWLHPCSSPLVSTFLILLSCHEFLLVFLRLSKVTAGRRCFSYSALRQSGLAICNFGDPYWAFFWRSGLIHSQDSSFPSLPRHCREEQIPVQRNGEGLSKLTAEWTRCFGNCLWVSYDIYFFDHPVFRKLSSCCCLVHFYSCNLPKFHMRKLWPLANADLRSSVAQECKLGTNWVLLQLRVNSANLFADGA